jgi:hypothetical protein
MDWWKKESVPSLYKLFAASYRYGFSDGVNGRRMQAQSYFSNDSAWHAYVAGYDAGKLKREQRAAETAGVAE